METSNLDILTEKIYQEGIEKAENEAADILANAQKEAEEILEKAHSESGNILAKAEKDAQQLAKKSEGEIRMKSNRMISDLQTRIKGLIRDRILRENIRELVMDPDFLKTVIQSLIENWNKDENAELVFSEELRSKIDKQFDQAIAHSLNNLSITFDERLSAGFRISRESDNYQLTFTEDDFNELFSGYLDERTSKLLFN
ncbi:MAG: V-type ATP synthase subunit E [Bacteroidetes bacterium]|nr:V-type ATP synthase subunit E [Bacteroidota bacterium]MDA1121112.1 V-type ATP synthase subunit E [Bacteroidota bacterium]